MRVDEWRAGTVLFPSVRIDATTDHRPLPRELAGDDAATTRPSVATSTTCVSSSSRAICRRVADSGTFDVVGGPAELFGARGQGIGLYVRDPDGNVVELRHYAV